MVEHRLDLPGDDDELTAAAAPFAAIAEAMAEVRATAPAPPEAERVDEERREAHMRHRAAAAHSRSTSGSPWCAAPGTCRR